MGKMREKAHIHWEQFLPNRSEEPNAIRFWTLLCELAVAFGLGLLIFLEGGVHASGTLVLGSCTAIALIAAVIRVVLRGQFRCIKSKGYIPLALFFLLAVISLSWSLDPGGSKLALVRCLPPFIIFGILVTRLPRPERLRYAADYLSVIGASAGVVWLASFHFDNLRENLPGNPNHLGLMFSALGSAAITSALIPRKKNAAPNFAAIFRFIAGLIAVAAAISTESRGALIGLAIGLSTPAIAQRKYSRIALLSLPVALMAGMIALWRIGIAPKSLDIRLDIWSSALSRALENPFFGFGFGTFDSIGKGLPLSHWTAATSYGHSTPVELLVETGLVGFCLAALTAILIGHDILKKPNRRYTSDALPFVACASALALPSIFEFHLFLPAISLLLAISTGYALAGISVSDPKRIRSVKVGKQQKQILMGAASTLAICLFIAGYFDFSSSRALELANRQLRLAHFDDAIRSYQRAARTSLQPAIVQAALGEAYLARYRIGGRKDGHNDPSIASIAFENAVKEKPIFGNAWAGLAETKRLMGDLDGRVNALVQAALSDGKALRGRWVQVAAAYMAAAQVDLAIDACHEANKARGKLSQRCLRAIVNGGGNADHLALVAGGRADHWLDLARYLSAMGYPAESIRRALIFALEIDSTFAQAAVALMDLEKSQNRNDQAISWGERTLAVGVTNTPLLLRLAELNASKGNLTRARDLAERILETLPRSETAHKIIATEIRKSQGIQAERHYWEGQAIKRPGWNFPLKNADRLRDEINQRNKITSIQRKDIL